MMCHQSAHCDRPVRRTSGIALHNTGSLVVVNFPSRYGDPL